MQHILSSFQYYTTPPDRKEHDTSKLVALAVLRRMPEWRPHSQQLLSLLQYFEGTLDTMVLVVRPKPVLLSQGLPALHCKYLEVEVLMFED